jgi:tetratricopeptide (TPR) repeat protein
MKSTNNPSKVNFERFNFNNRNLKWLFILSFFIFQNKSLIAQNNLASIIEKVDQSIFKLIAFDYNDKSISQGSGVFISTDGIGISNYHVLENTDSAYIISNNGKTYPIDKILDFDTVSDLIKFKVNLVTIPVTFDLNKPNRGEDVFALGYPCGLTLNGGSTLSKGIISAFRQTDYMELLQTSAQITHGSSGGGLFNNSGKLIGITSGTFAQKLADVHANLYKAIPVNYIIKLTKNINKTLPELKESKEFGFTLNLFEYYKSIGQFYKAEQLIVNLIQKNVTNSRLWNKYATILGRGSLNKKEILFTCLENAIALDSTQDIYKINYSIALSEYNIFDRALKILNKSKFKELNYHYYYAYGYCLAGQRKYIDAIYYFEKCNYLYDNRFNNQEILQKANYELAYCLNKTEKYLESNNVINKLSEINPDYYMPRLLMARNYFSLGLRDKACTELTMVKIFGNAREKRLAENDWLVLCQ